jgi:hypothetical protein
LHQAGHEVNARGGIGRKGRLGPDCPSCSNSAHRAPSRLDILRAFCGHTGGNAPSRSFYFGIVDLAGFPKDRFYLYQSRWRPELPMAHLLPHWNWAGREVQVTPVHVYTSGDTAELFLNGEILMGSERYRLGRHPNTGLPPPANG